MKHIETIWTACCIGSDDHDYSLNTDKGEPLDQPEFVGEGISGADDAVEAAKDAHEFTRQDIDVHADGKLIGTWTSSGWRAVVYHHILRRSVEVLDAASIENAKDAALEEFFDNEGPDTVSDLLTGEQAKAILRDARCEIRKTRFTCGTGWTAWILSMRAYRYNEFGEIEDLGGEFAEWKAYEGED